MVGERAILYNIRNTCRPHILASVNKGRNKILSSGIVIKTLFDTRMAKKIPTVFSGTSPIRANKRVSAPPGMEAG